MTQERREGEVSIRPPCPGRQRHRWFYITMGGLIEDCRCLHCGTYRRQLNGRDTYRMPDADSLAWVEEVRQSIPVIRIRRPNLKLPWHRRLAKRIRAWFLKHNWSVRTGGGTGDGQR